MDAAAAARALSQSGLEPTTIEPILGGWASWTFALDERWIARFPRTDTVAEATGRELRLLPWLADQVSFEVPGPSHVGTWNDKPFFAYPMIPGRGFTSRDATPGALERLKAILAELHAVSVDTAAGHLGIASPESAWRESYEELWPMIETVALPALSTELATEVERGFDAFLGLGFDHPHVLVHNDLGLEHVIVDESAGQPVGLIDFEDAWIGDPAIDFVPLKATLSRSDFAEMINGRDLGPHLAERMHFYRWMGSVHAIIHGITEHDETILADGLAELPRRLAQSE